MKRDEFNEALGIEKALEKVLAAKIFEPWPGFDVGGRPQTTSSSSRSRPSRTTRVRIACLGCAVRLHLSEHKGDGRTGAVVYFWVDDVDEVASEFGVKVVQQPWARQVDLMDPDGNFWRVGERNTGVE